MKKLFRRHPWLVLLGFFPPIYVVGLVRTWGKPEYDDEVMFSIAFIDIHAPTAALWWPLFLYRIKKRTRDKLRRQYSR